jgi:hypothetical protein
MTLCPHAARHLQHDTQRKYHTIDKESTVLTWLPAISNLDIIISILIVSNVHVLDTKTEHFQNFALLHPLGGLVIATERCIMD